MNQAVKRLPGSRDLVAEQRIRNLTSFLDLIERDSYQKQASYMWLTCGSSELLTSDVFFGMLVPPCIFESSGKVIYS